MNLQRYGTIIALLVLVVFFSLASGSFIEPRNLLDILAHISMLTIIATGLTVCMVTGDFDMSIASVASLSGVLLASFVLKGFPLGIALLIVVLAGAVFGLVGGILITKVKVSAFIATLALGSIATGINFMYTRGQEVFGEFKPDFLFLGQGKVFGVVPTQVVLMACVVALFAFVMEKTKTGRWMYAIGGSIRSAYHSGIRVNLYRVVGLVLSGALAAFTGCVLASRLGSGQPTAGDAFLMDAIAAAYIGMTTVKVSRPNIIGTLIGALIMGVIDNGLVLMGVSYFFQYIAKGAIIILAVALTSRGSAVVER
jgi:ribose/xylose/arabinose/galactoside ABC-type transport system permease subunit